MSRVLVIDDDPSITRLLEEHLSNEGHDVSSVHLAEDGFLRATTAPPELIFLDVMLPDATGFQILGRFRKNPLTRTIPIIMMTGTARNANQEQIGRSMGADDYLLKPFDVLELGDRVQRLIERHREKEPLGEPAPGASILDAIVREPEPITLKPEPAIAPPVPPEPITPEPEPVIAPPQTPEPKPEPVAAAAETPENPALAFRESMRLDFIAEAEKKPAKAIKTPAKAVKMPAKGTKPASLNLLAGLFVFHLILAWAAPDFGGFQTLSVIAAGWALLLGLLTGTCALLGIPIEIRQALRILAWAAIPIVVRTAANLLGIIPNPGRLPGALFWLRPLDIFELVSGVIFAVSLRRLPGSSLAKCLLAVLSIALAWALCGRGYFRPF